MVRNCNADAAVVCPGLNDPAGRIEGTILYEGPPPPLSLRRGEPWFYVRFEAADPISYPPSAVTYVSYGQLTLDFARIRSACPQAADVQILSSAAFNTYAYTVRNPDGSTTSYRESNQGLMVK